MEIHKKEYKSLDVFKIIFAVFVVMIHARPFADISETTNWFISNSLFNLAVPFFFVTSGFLLFNKLKRIKEEQEKTKIVKAYVVRILKMYLIWSAIWLPLKVLNWWNNGGGIKELGKYLIDLFLTGRTGDALWYLLALAVCASLVAFISRNGKKRLFLVLGISIALYAFGVFISSYYKLVEGNIVFEWYFKIFQSTDNALFNGLMFFSLGAVIANYNVKINGKISGLCLFLTVLMMGFEVFFVWRTGYNREGVCELITLPLVILFLFELILKLNINMQTEHSRLLRDLSILIYLSHCLIIRLLDLGFNIIEVSVPHTVLFIITLILSVLFAMIIRYFRGKDIKLFKVLY